MNQRRYSTGIIFLKSNVVGNSPFRERLGSNRLPDKPRPRSGSKVLERSKASQSVDTPSSGSGDAETDAEHDGFRHLILKAGTDYQEIVDHMKNPSTGVGFLCPLPSLPKYTFVSADAVQWLINHVEGIKEEEQAIQLLQNMLSEKYICHASGNGTRRFIHGFYLYHIRCSKEELKDGETLPTGDLAGFENEWVEVEVVKAPPVSKAAFFKKELPAASTQLPSASTFKQSHLELDAQNRSDRVEWGHIKYHSVYNPTKAYEIQVQWAAASGAIVADLIFGWARKAQSCGLQMVPIPADPFALPCSLKADPLRSPVFVPVDIECLMGNRSYLFEEFEETTRNQRLILFLEAVALRFGFTRCEVPGTNSQFDQFIHLSGNSFLLIPSNPCEHSTNLSLSASQQSRSGASPDIAPSPSQEYMSCLMANIIHCHETGVGFLWSKNHMVSRRWKLGSTCATSDDTFLNKLYTDFTAFCRNEEGRLLAFWNQCQEVREN